VITDALEMRAISATIGVEEGAVRALAAGADALCLGHDLWEEATDGLVAAIVAAVRDGRLSEERLADAADRVAELGAWARRDASVTNGDREIGLEAARRALDVSGELAPLAAPTVVVELRPEPSIAVGDQPYGLGDALRARLASVDVVRRDAGSLDGLADAMQGRDRVVVVQDAHRHAWQREVVDQLAAQAGRTIVVETGLPYWRPPATTAFLATHGAGRACLEAAAERLARPDA
jgi:beta-N-acetylhexosaminidase